MNFLLCGRSEKESGLGGCFYFVDGGCDFSLSVIILLIF